MIWTAEEIIRNRKLGIRALLSLPKPGILVLCRDESQADKTESREVRTIKGVVEGDAGYLIDVILIGGRGVRVPARSLQIEEISIEEELLFPIYDGEDDVLPIGAGMANLA